MGADSDGPKEGAQHGVDVGDELHDRVSAVVPALRAQLEQRLPGKTRLPNIRCGASRRLRNRALHDASWDGGKELGKQACSPWSSRPPSLCLSLIHI
eukprot:3455471-Prorocentrum_lima.AAC.1